jgi:hypothetical protein
MYADVGDLRMSAMVAAAHVMPYLGQPNGGCGHGGLRAYGAGPGLAARAGAS